MVDYTWSVNLLSVLNYDGVPPNTVNKIHWKLVGVDGAYRAEVSTDTAVPYDQTAPFTPFEQLTEEQVCGWIENLLGVDRVNVYKVHVAKLIQDQVPPVDSVVQPPWQQ